jgi:hypothetical protein
LGILSHSSRTTRAWAWERSAVVAQGVRRMAFRRDWMAASRPVKP